MSFAIITLMLAALWSAITGNFDGLNILLGLAIGALVATVLGRGGEAGGLRRLGSTLSLVWLFLHELCLSAFRVARIVLTPNLRDALRPAIIAFPLSVKSDAEIALLANLITLTPGTLSVDVSADKNLLYVHALTFESRDKVIAEIAAGFEAKIREVYR